MCGSQNLLRRVQKHSHVGIIALAMKQHPNNLAVASAISWAVCLCSPPLLHCQQIGLVGEVRLEGQQSSWDREAMGHWGAGGGRPPLSCGLAARCPSRRPQPPPWPRCLQDRNAKRHTTHSRIRHTGRRQQRGRRRKEQDIFGKLSRVAPFVPLLKPTFSLASSWVLVHGDNTNDPPSPKMINTPHYIFGGTLMLVIFCSLKNSMLRSTNINSWCSCVMNAFSIKKEQCDKHSQPQTWHQTCTHEMTDTLKFKRHDLHAHDNIYKCIINNFTIHIILVETMMLTFSYQQHANMLVLKSWWFVYWQSMNWWGTYSVINQTSIDARQRSSSYVYRCALCPWCASYQHSLNHQPASNAHFESKLQSVNVVGYLKLTPTNHEHKRFVNAEQAKPVMNKMLAMSKLILKKPIWSLCV